MRILTTIILCALCAMQAVAQSEPKDIYTFDDKGEIVVNKKFIDTHVEREDSEVKPYELIGISTFEAHSKKYELQVLDYNGWKDEAGDFRIIRLFHNDKQILEFIDEEAWIGNPLIEDEKTWIGGASRDIYSGGAHFSEFEDSISKYATYTGHYLIYPLENKCTALLFNGFSWSSQVPLLTIILIKGDEAKVVFNQSWGIEIFKADDKGFDLTLMANYPEYVDEDNIPDIWYPDFHRLYTTPGSMKFEKSDLDWVEYVTEKYGKAPEDSSIPIIFKLNCTKQEKATNMLKEFYTDYVFGLKPFQLDAAKYCTPRFLSKLGKDYEARLKEDYIISQEEVGLEWWSFYNFINGYQDGPNEIDEVIKVVHEHDNTYRIYFIECGYENHRLIDLVERNDSLFIDDAYRLKYDSNGEVRY